MSDIVTNPEKAIEAIAIGCARSSLAEAERCAENNVFSEGYEAGMIVGMTAMWRRIEKACSNSDALLIAIIDQ